MNRAERAARDISVGLMLTERDEKAIATILRREFRAAWEEAAGIVEGHFASCPCCDRMTLPHLDGCTFDTDCPGTAEAWRKWPECAAAIRARADEEEA